MFPELGKMRKVKESPPHPTFFLPSFSFFVGVKS